MATCQCFPVIRNGEGQKVKLNIGIDDASTATNMTTTLKMVGRAQAPMGEQPLSPYLGLSQQLDCWIQSDWLRALLLEVKLEVIHQVLADTRAVVQHLYAVLAQLLLRPNAGTLQNGWRHDRTR